MTIDGKKLLVRGLQIAAAACAAALLGFALVGWSNGFAVGSALVHLFETLPTSDQNPKLADIEHHEVSWLGNIENRELAESSGLAASNVEAGVLWSMNDSGSGPEIFAFTTGGAHLGTWTIEMEEPVDWEAMDSFTLDGTPYLLVADVGDNFRWRPTLSFVVVEEPQLSTAGAAIPVAWSASFSYPEGYRDCEAVAVDEAAREVLLVSKRRHPSEVYTLPLRPEGHVTARKIAALTHLPRPTALDLEEDPHGGIYRHMPSGMDLDGDKLIITTNQHAYLYDRRDLTRAPLRVQLPSVGQREAIAFSHHEPDVAFMPVFTSMDAWAREYVEL